MKCHYCVYELPRDDSKAGYSSVCGQCGMTQPTPGKQLAPDVDDGAKIEAEERAARLEHEKGLQWERPVVDDEVQTPTDGAQRLDGSD